MHFEFKCEVRKLGQSTAHVLLTAFDIILPRGREQGTEQKTVQGTTVLGKKVLKLLHRGHVSKAVRRVVSHGIADHFDQRVAAQLQSFPLKK